MKKIIIVSIMILAAAAVFATGNQEANEAGVVELVPRALVQDNFLNDLEKVEVSGVVKFESPVPELVSSGKDYTLTAPGLQMFAGMVTEGQLITVSGYLIDDDAYFGPGMGRNGGRGVAGGRLQDTEVLEGNINLLVETVEIDGVVYQLPWVNRGGFGAGFGSGKGRGNGRGNGMMGGNGNFRQGGRNGGYVNEDCPYYN
ncbi:MAG: hypothetical protein JEZ04_14795 [Spirochaetales bacterium]|nr:hypothetical protein [Spirochaetales bacterium]